MKRKIFFKFVIFIVISIMLIVLTGCGDEEKSSNNNNSNNSTVKDNMVSNTSDVSSTSKKADNKIYKYVKMSSAISSTLLYSANSLFDDPAEVSRGDTYYKPCIIAEFDTETGKAKKATFYAFFIDYEDDEYVNKTIEKFNSASSESKKNFKNVKKGRVADNISYLSAELEVDSYIYTQFIDTYIIKSQDIEKYKDEVYYSRLYNYSSNPPHEEGENYFEESLEGIRIEWSNSEIKPY